MPQSDTGFITIHPHPVPQAVPRQLLLGRRPVSSGLMYSDARWALCR
jgi:hypothetical protein